MVVAYPHLVTELSFLSLNYLPCQNDNQTESAASTLQVTTRLATRKLIQFM